MTIKIYLTDAFEIDRKRSSATRTYGELYDHLDGHIVYRPEDCTLTIDWDAAGIPPKLRAKIVVVKIVVVRPKEGLPNVPLRYHSSLCSGSAIHGSTGLRGTAQSSTNGKRPNRQGG